jgi:hypothetical protein
LFKGKLGICSTINVSQPERHIRYTFIIIIL